MRTFTVVPSFEGESAFFELPDIGFQGDHLSFAILFNLNELVEHWPGIVPSMIVTDPKNNTFIAPYTSWNAETHIFTWYISSTETTYDGYLKCQLKCTSADDPEVIVCMSRICQTRVYESLVAAEDPPEAFQSWIDSLVQLGAEIAADADVAQRSMETTATNARTAQAAAEAAELSKNAAEAARSAVDNIANVAVNAQRGATQAQQRAEIAASEAEAARQATAEAKADADELLEEIDRVAENVASNARTASDAAEQASTSMQSATTARNEAVAARDAAINAKGAAETAQERAEAAEEGAQSAQTAARQSATAAATSEENATRSASDASASQTAAASSKADAEAAQTAAEAAMTRAETARDGVENYADLARKWAVGKDLEGNDVPSTEPMYENNAKHWADVASQYAGTVLNFGLYVDENGNGYIRSIDD